MLLLDGTDTTYLPVMSCPPLWMKRYQALRMLHHSIPSTTASANIQFYHRRPDLVTNLGCCGWGLWDAIIVLVKLVNFL
jgi:hypothetical protein